MISLVHLKYFQDAALLQSVAASARKHRVSPSAVSQAIRSLEAHFGLELLRHSRSRFELSDEGRLLLDRSFSLITATEKLEEDMAWTKAAYTGQVHFATQQSIAHHMLPEFFGHLQTRYPALQPKMQLATTDTVRRRLEQREIEFGLSVDNAGFEAFAAKPILKGEFVFVQASGSKLDTMNFLITADTKETVIFRREYQRRYGHVPRIAMEVDSWGLIKRFAARGLGIGLIPDYLLRFDGGEGLQRVSLDLPTIPYQIRAFYCGRRNTLSKNSRLFLDELEAYAGRSQGLERSDKPKN